MVVETNLRIDDHALNVLRELNAEECADKGSGPIDLDTRQAGSKGSAKRKSTNAKRRRGRTTRKSSSPLVMRVEKSNADGTMTPTRLSASLGAPAKGAEEQKSSENDDCMSVASGLSEMSMAETIMGQFGKQLEYGDEDIEIKVRLKGNKVKKMMMKLEKLKKLNLELCSNMEVLETRLANEQKRVGDLEVEKTDLQHSQHVLEQTRARLETKIADLEDQLKQVHAEKQEFFRDLSNTRVELAQATTELSSTRVNLISKTKEADKLSCDLDCADREIRDTRTKHNQAEELLRAAHEQHNILRKENEELRQKLQESLKNAEALGKEAASHMQRGDELLDAKRALEKNLAAENASRTNLTKETEALTATLHLLRKEGAEMQRTNTHLTEAVHDLKEESKHKQTKIDSLIAEKGGLNERVVKLESQRTELKAKYVDVKKQVKEVTERERHAVQTAQHFQTQLKDSQGQAEVLHRGLTRAQTQIDAHEGHMAETSTEVSGLRAQVEDLQAEVEAMHGENAELNAEILDLEKANTRMKKEMSEARHAGAEAESQITRLKRANASISAKDKRRREQLEQLKSENLTIKKKQAKQLISQKKMLKAAAPDLNVPIVGLGADMQSYLRERSEGRIVPAELTVVQNKLNRLAMCAKTDCTDLRRLVQNIHVQLEEHRHLWADGNTTGKSNLRVPTGGKRSSSPSFSSMDNTAENTPDSVRDIVHN